MIIQLAWPADELDSETDDEFWSKFADKESDAMLAVETLDILAHV